MASCGRKILPIFGEAAVRAMQNACFDTDLTDAQWDYLQPMLPAQTPLASPDRLPRTRGRSSRARAGRRWFPGLRRLWVDGGHAGAPVAQWVRDHRPWLEVEVVRRSDAATGFAVLPRRWIVERTFALLVHHRRLIRDYERTTAGAEAWFHTAVIRIQLRRLA